MQTFLFDIDGTLVDSSASIEKVWRRLAVEYGADADKILAHCHGRRDVEVVGEFFATDVAGAVLSRITLLEMDLVAGVTPVPGALELTASLEPDQWAVVTSGPRGLMEARLRTAGLPVPRVMVTAEDVTAGKPDPEGFMMAAAALGAAPSNCVVVEDSPPGVAAGKAAGAFVVAVTVTHGASALAAADLVVVDLSELPGALPEGTWRD